MKGELDLPLLLGKPDSRVEDSMTHSGASSVFTMCPSLPYFAKGSITDPILFPLMLHSSSFTMVNFSSPASPMVSASRKNEKDP